MASLLEHEGTVRQMFGDGFSDQQISNHLMEIGLRRGASERSVKQFRLDRGWFRRQSISDQHLELAVANAIDKVSLCDATHLFNHDNTTSTQ